MARESTQHKLDRVRSPRVQITYDVEVGGAIELKELPFVVGVLGDFTGQPEQPLPRLKDRKFVEVKPGQLRHGFGRHETAPQLLGSNKLSEEPDAANLKVDLKFAKMEDFEPPERGAPGEAARRSCWICGRGFPICAAVCRATTN